MGANCQWSGSVPIDTNYQGNTSYFMSKDGQCYGGGSTIYYQQNGMTNDVERMIQRCENEIY